MDLDSAILKMQISIDATPEDDSDLADRLESQAKFLSKRGQRDDIDRATDLLQRSLSATPTDDEDYAKRYRKWSELKQRRNNGSHQSNYTSDGRSGQGWYSGRVN
jgi:hypothetical protein